jgi:hypothetical protein
VVRQLLVDRLDELPEHKKMSINSNGFF